MILELAFRVRVERAGAIDRELAALPSLVLLRQDGELYARCDVGSVDDLRAALARAGLAVDPAPVSLRRAGARAAIVRSLAPIPSAALCDTVTLRRPGMGEAIARVREATADLLGRRRAEQRERIRGLLRDEDRLLSWQRVVWADARALRSARIPGARPIVFDRDAIAHVPERIAYAADGLLARWMTA